MREREHPNEITPNILIDNYWAEKLHWVSNHSFIKFKEKHKILRISTNFVNAQFLYYIYYYYKEFHYNDYMVHEIVPLTFLEHNSKTTLRNESKLRICTLEAFKIEYV